MNLRLPLTVLYLIDVYYYCYGLPDAQPSNILVFLPTETKSHFIGFKPLLEKLVARGHNLTLVSPFPIEPVAKNGSTLSYTYIKVEIKEKTPSGLDFLDKGSLINRIPQFIFLLWIGPILTRLALEKKTVKDFIADDRSSFDLVVIENFFHECFVTLGHKYGVPVVQLLPFATNPRVSQWHSNPYDPSYIADFTGDYAAPLTFQQRAVNTLAAVFSTWVNRLVYMPRQRAIMDEYFAYAGHERRPDLDTMLRNVSLTLINSHPLLSSVAPYVPSYIQVAGMHVKPARMLPKDLKTVLDAAGDRGVIYFSLGSIIKSSKIPRETIKFLLTELSKVEQMVLWKWEDSQIPDLPKNVIVQKWFPQNDILGHPNCRLFITHGGIHSLIESIYHGVPMLSIPVFGDQPHNSIEAQQRGFALYVSYFELTAETFGSKLRELLRDPRFGEAAKKASTILRDNPTTILDKAVFWIEYVIRHKGAPHLRTAANGLYWFQFYLLDVIAAIALVLVSVFYLSYKFWTYLLKKICLTKPTATRTSKNKKKKH